MQVLHYIYIYILSPGLCRYCIIYIYLYTKSWSMQVLHYIYYIYTKSWSMQVLHYIYIYIYLYTKSWSMQVLHYIYIY